MTKKCIAFLLVSVLVLGLLAGCGPKEDPEAANYYTLGVLAPLTGTNAEYGKGFEIAAQIACDEINEAGGINGKKLRIKVGDSKGEAKESSDLARQYIDDPSIIAIVGDFSSGASMANAPIVDEAQMVQISPTASNPDYAAMSPYTFGIMGRQDAEGPFFSTYILGKKMGAKKVAVIYINSDWGQAAYTAVTEQMEKDGIELTGSADYVQGESDFSSVVAKARQDDPDTVLILDQGAVPQILNTMSQAGWDDVQIATLGAGASQQLIDLAGESAAGLYTSTPFFFDEANEKDQAWRELFKERAGFEPTVHPVCAYDCVYVLAEALKAGGADVDRQGLAPFVQKVRLAGMTGPIAFNEGGDITRSYIIAQVIDGAWELVEGYDYAK